MAVDFCRGGAYGRSYLSVNRGTQELLLVERFGFESLTVPLGSNYEIECSAEARRIAVRYYCASPFAT